MDAKDGGRVQRSSAFVSIKTKMPTEADNVINHEEVDESNENPTSKRETRSRKKKYKHDHLRLMRKPSVITSNTNMAA